MFYYSKSVVWSIEGREKGRKIIPTRNDTELNFNLELREKKKQPTEYVLRSRQIMVFNKVSIQGKKASGKLYENVRTV